MALQPALDGIAIFSNLRQQKLLWHYSQQSVGLDIQKSTIVEIIMALQPCLTLSCGRRGSTIVEIIMALQPINDDQESDEIYDSRNYYGIIAIRHKPSDAPIYDSRNYYGIIALMQLPRYLDNLRQQKLLWHYSPMRIVKRGTSIYDSRNYYGIIAFQDPLR